MILCDVNVLIRAHRSDAKEHAAYAELVTSMVESPEPYGLSELVLSGFIRIVTKPGVWVKPSTTTEALEFVSEIVDRPNARMLRPGLEHFGIFVKLLRETKATDNLVSDAYYASLAIEHGCEWLTDDGDFARFRGLRVRHPLAR